MKTSTKNLMLTAMMLLLAIASFAQGRGNLTGYIKDNTGAILPGAAVFLKGTTLGTSTDINGVYTLQGIPAGEAEISVNYLGYAPFSAKTKVSAGSMVNFNITLTQLSKSIEGVTVTAMIDGQQRALNQQLMADNVMQVISADQIGLFPDLNVADALKRVSGVTSDGTRISLRGTPDSFTSINIDGEQMIGTGEGGVRAPNVDLIPSDVLSSMEIQKTLLPSSDGDAIGGAINLRSSEARSLKPKFNVDLGTGFNFLRDKGAFNGKLGYEQRFNKTDKNPNGTWGIAAKYSYNNTYGGYDRIEATAWKESTLNTVNDGKSGGSPLRPDMNQPVGDDNQAYKRWIPTDFRYRYEESKSIRQGATLVLDWAPTLNTKFVLVSGYNNKSKDATRYRNRNRFRSRDFYWQMDQVESLPSEGTPAYEASPEGGFGANAIGADRLQNIVQYTKQKEGTDNYNVNLSGQSIVGNWKVDGSVAYSYSLTTYRSMMPGFSTPQYRGGDKNAGTGDPAWNTPRRYLIGYIPDINTPFMTMNYLQKVNGQTAGIAPDDLSRYYLNIIENWDYNTEGANLTAQLNSSYNHFIGTNASTFQFGIKGKFMNNKGWVPEGMSRIYGSSSFAAANMTPELALSSYLHKDLLSSNFAGGNIAFKYAPDGAKINSNIKQLEEALGYNTLDSERAADAYKFNSQEKIFAAYLMEKIQFKNLMALVGVRLEHNSVKYGANKIFRYDQKYPNDPNGQMPEADRTEDWIPVYDAYKKNPVDSTINYTMVLPNIQIKWDLGKRSVIRAAYTTGYSRPNAMYLVPKQDINSDLGIVSIGNPDLKAAYSHNVDILFERFLSNVGIISGGLFFKAIDNFQFLSQSPIDNNSPYYFEGGNMSVIRQYKNGDGAKVYGAEVTVNSSLSFLPGFLKNLMFTSNYTFVHSKATVERMSEESAAAALKVSSRLPGQADHTANFALAYSTKRFTIQASYNYIGSYILTIGADPNQDVWLEGRWQLDLNGSVNLYKGLSFYVEAQNILNKEAYQYFGDKSRMYDYRLNGTVARCGFSYRF